jgi:rhodanese-related sulfurtransferase
MKRLVAFVLACLTVVLGVAGGVAGAGAQDARAIDAMTAHGMVVSGGMVLVDIRRPDEWRQTGVPENGHLITMHQNGAAFVNAILAAAGGDIEKPVGLICATGVRSAHVQNYLTRFGFKSVYNVAPGMLGSRFGIGWIRAGLPVRRWSR